MKKSSLFFVLVLGLIISSCGNTAETAETQETATTEEVTPTPKEKATPPAVSPQAATPVSNQTPRVAVDKVASQGITNMTAALKGIMKAKTKTIATYNTLGNQLDKELKIILEKNGATGAAQVKLNEILDPMADLIATLKGTDVAKCNKAVKKVGRQISLFNAAFQK